jgi:hypothetical protein
MKAFPKTNEPLTYPHQDGMDLRDYFAIHVEPLSLIDLFYSENPSSFKDHVFKNEDEIKHEIRLWMITKTTEEIVELKCKYRYLEADAMMKAREQND